MKKLLAALAATALCVPVLDAAPVFANSYGAKTYTYSYTDEDGNDDFVYGALRRVSPGGLWAVGGDDLEETGGFIIDVTNPQAINHLSDGSLNDVDDSGMAVGTWYEVMSFSKYKRAAIYKNGEWKLLPEPEAILKYDGVSMTSEAVAISADSKTIAGHAMCANDAPDEPGKYFPVVWRLNEATDEYELYKLYNDIPLPGALGFYVYDMTPDAKYICGLQNLNMGSSVAALLNVETGQLQIWHDIDTREITWEYGGNTYFSDVMTVDGLIEEGQLFSLFAYATNDYIYGSRSIVVSVDDDGYGEADNVAAVYDLNTQEFVDGDESTIYMCGKGLQNLFTNSGYALLGENTVSLRTLTNSQIAGVYSIDDAGKVMTGSMVITTPLGDQVESPVLVVFEDTPLGIESVDVQSPAMVSVNGRQLSVSGANNVTVYNATGTLVGTANNQTLRSGVYVVVADGKATKVVVK